MGVVRMQAGDDASLMEGFQRVHNTTLDELLNDDIIGLFSMLAAFFSLFVYI